MKRVGFDSNLEVVASSEVALGRISRHHRDGGHEINWLFALSSVMQRVRQTVENKPIASEILY